MIQANHPLVFVLSGVGPSHGSPGRRRDLTDVLSRARLRSPLLNDALRRLPPIGQRDVPGVGLVA